MTADETRKMLPLSVDPKQRLGCKNKDLIELGKKIYRRWYR